MRAHPGHKDDGVQMTGGLPAIQTRKKMVKVICNQALDEMLVSAAAAALRRTSAVLEPCTAVARLCASRRDAAATARCAQSGANSHKVFRSLGCLVSHANKMGKTAEQVHNLDLNLQLVSALS